VKFKTFLTSLICIAFVSNMAAQHPHGKSKLLRKLQRVVWTVGLSGVVVDDDGKPFTNLFNVNDSWTYLPYPTKLSFEGYIDYGLSIEGTVTYSVLKEGKIFNDYGNKRSEDVNLFAFDCNGKYDLNELFGKNKILGPYVIGGIGYTYRALTTQRVGINANFGFGLNIWLYKGLGLNLQSMAKFAIDKTTSNYLQHSAGLVYRFSFLRGYKPYNARTSRRYNLFRN